MEAPGGMFNGRLPGRPFAISPKVLFSDGGTPCRKMATTGFWNDLPTEEERIPLPPMKPTYGRRELEYQSMGWLNLSELGLFLGIIYGVIGGTHLAIMFLHWKPH